MKSNQLKSTKKTVLGVLGSVMWFASAQTFAADPALSTSCATPDNNAIVTTCFYDLTSSPASTQAPTSAVLNSGIFRVPGQTGDLGKGTIVGTGVFQPFVRIQDKGNAGSNGVNIEAGYNTDGRDGVGQAAMEIDNHDKGGSNWNHSIKLKDIPTVTVCDGGGTTGTNCKQYYEFLLDINEQGNSPNSGLSLDEFKLFTAGVGDIHDYTGYDGTTGISDFALTGATQRYNMDAGPGGDASILMDYRNFSGSGNGVDLQALVSVDNFKDSNGNFLPGLSGESYVYLYSKFGWTGDKCQQVQENGNANQPYLASPCMTPDGTNGAGVSIASAGTKKTVGELSFGSDAGFEEWSIRKQTPVPATLLLLGVGAAGLLVTRRRQKCPG